jgi:hypothetical protein
MRFLIKVVYLILLPYACLARKPEDPKPSDGFMRRFSHGTTRLKNLNEKIQHLPEENKPSYFGKSLAQQRTHFKTLYDKCSQAYAHYFMEAKKQEPGLQVRSFVFSPYCHTIYLTTGLHNLRDIFSVDSPVQQDTREALDCFALFEDLFLPFRHLLYDFLKINSSKKDCWNIMRHHVTLDVRAAFNAQKQEIPHLLTLLEPIDASQFTGPPGYQDMCVKFLAVGKKIFLHTVTLRQNSLKLTEKVDIPREPLPITQPMGEQRLTEKVDSPAEFSTDPYALIFKRLQQIMTQSKNIYPMIFKKAYACNKSLEQHPELLEQAQEATQCLAFSLQTLEPPSQGKENTYYIEKKQFLFLITLCTHLFVI